MSQPSIPNLPKHKLTDAQRNELIRLLSMPRNMLSRYERDTLHRLLNPPLGRLDTALYILLSILALPIVIHTFRHILQPVSVYTDLPFLFSYVDDTAFWLAFPTAFGSLLLPLAPLVNLELRLPLFGQKGAEYPQDYPLLRSLRHARKDQIADSLTNRILLTFFIIAALSLTAISMNLSHRVRYLHMDGSVSCYDGPELRYIAQPDEVHTVLIECVPLVDDKHDAALHMILKYRNHENLMISLCDQSTTESPDIDRTLLEFVRLKELFPAKTIQYDIRITPAAIIESYHLSPEAAETLYALLE